MISTELAQVANSAPGSYLFEFDQSQIPAAASISNLRLLVGQSKVGRVNTVVYIDTPSAFEDEYGQIDRNLERRGCFFHRMATQMLEAGPILCLNIRSFSTTDVAGMRELSSSFSKLNGIVKSVQYTKAWNTSRLWFVDPQEILDIANNDKLLTFMNIGSVKKSVYVKRSSTTQYPQTVGDYYRSLGLNRPTYLNDFDVLGYTFVDVYLFDEDFGDPSLAMKNADYGHLFDANGLKTNVVNSFGETVSALDQLSNISESKFVKKYVGSLIPDLVAFDKTSSLSIENIMNSDIANSRLVIKLNTAILDQAELWEPTLDVNDRPIYASNGAKMPYPIDLVGHNLFSLNASAALDKTAYNAGTFNMLSYAGSTELQAMKLNYAELKELLPITTAIEYVGLSYPLKKNLTAGVLTSLSILEDNSLYYTGPYSHQVGDYFVAKDGSITAIKDIMFLGTTKIILGFHTSKFPLQSNGTPFPKNVDGVYVYPTGHVNEGKPVVYDLTTGYPLSDIGGSVIAIPTLTTIQMDALVSTYGTTRNVFKYSFNRSILVDGVTTITLANPSLDPQKKIKLLDGTSLEVFENTNSSYFSLPIGNIVSNYQVTTLKNYKQRAAQFVDGTPATQNAILTWCVNELRKGINNRQKLSFDYIVDAFKTYIEPNFKNQLLTLAEGRKMVNYLASFPSVRDFKKSTNPYFTDNIGGKFRLSYLRTGGNTSLPFTNTFSPPTINGSFGCGFGPNIIIDDFGSELSMPISGAVSNCFVRKQRSTNPYDLVAGDGTGVVAVSGMKRLEDDFDGEDRGELMKVGYNPVIMMSGVAQIYGNDTFQYITKSAMSKIHVRELINNIQRQILPVLDRYEWKFNTPQNRVAIKGAADNICLTAKGAGAIISYTNTIDTTNNTAEVIENAIGLLDTVLVPGFGMEKMVYRLYVNTATRTATMVQV